MSDELIEKQQESPPEDSNERPLPTEWRVFVPIQKVDQSKHEVWGLATIEEPDASGEVMDYASSKPLFQEWSETAQKRSQGKSWGNLRSMHQNVAAGKLIDIKFDDARKAIPIGTKVTNPNEWDQVQEGVYTGFSVGGRYEKRWYDNSNGLMRYTARPAEISLVDAPCVPDATFQMIKDDGSMELRKFAHSGIPEVKKADLPASPKPSPFPIEDVKAQKMPDPSTTRPSIG